MLLSVVVVVDSRREKGRGLSAQIPQLELLPLVAERLVAKCRTRAGDAVLEVVVQPEAVMPVTAVSLAPVLLDGSRTRKGSLTPRQCSNSSARRKSCSRSPHYTETP
jgi:hypothetical protein